MFSILQQNISHLTITYHLINLTNDLKSSFLFQFSLLEMKRKEPCHHFSNMRIPLFLKNFLEKTAIVLNDHIPHSIVMNVKVDNVKSLSELFRSILRERLINISQIFQLFLIINNTYLLFKNTDKVSQSYHDLLPIKPRRKLSKCLLKQVNINFIIIFAFQVYEQIF